MSEFLDELLVVLVIYKMKIAESAAYHSLTQALTATGKSISLFIYDNSPQVQRPPDDSVWSVCYFHDPSNPGVSKAYNEGFRMAKGKNKKRMLLVDQDTEFSVEIFSKYKDAWVGNACAVIVPMVKSDAITVSPYQFKFGRGRPCSTIDAGCYQLEDYKFINSGTLIGMDHFEKCQGYDERFPLDFSDLVFIQRLKKHCERFRLIDTVCCHGLSSERNFYQNALERFPYFMRGSRLYGKLYGDNFLLFINRLLRSFKLSYKFRSFRFISLFFQIENENLRA